jgi:hypothetical protein
MLRIGYSHTVPGPETMNTPTPFRTIGTEVKYKEIKTIIWVPGTVFIHYR